MEIDIHTALSLLMTGAVGVVGFLLNRSIRAVDLAIEKVGAKVDELAKADTALQVQIADLTARVRALEGSHDAPRH